MFLPRQIFVEFLVVVDLESIFFFSNRWYGCILIFFIDLFQWKKGLRIFKDIQLKEFYAKKFLSLTLNYFESMDSTI